MIGLPPDHTKTELALRWVGIAGCGLGILMVLASPFLLFGWPMLSMIALSLFFIGASGVVAGLCMSALSQGLASLRLIAANS